MLNKILELSERHGFLKKVVYPRLRQEVLKIGPVGALLKENLLSEWHKNIVINKDVTVFLNESDFSETFDFAKAICIDQFPFGIAEVIQNKRAKTVDELIEDFKSRSCSDKDLSFGDYFKTENRISLRCSIFVPPAQSTQFFHHWQKQRRMWWRKVAASPGRYSLTDIRTGESNTQNVEILAKYPWGQQLIETVTLNTSSPKDLFSNQLQLKEGKKTVTAHHIVSDICLSTTVLNTICDAYDEPQFHGNPRPLFHFHRKLAPYKISFAITAPLTSAVAELNDLALYICKQLRNIHVSTLLLPSCSKHTLEAQWKQYDQLGVPYTVLLNEGTLRDGIAHLRSRDTTLKEQVHVTNLVTYVEQLFRNY